MKFKHEGEVEKEKRESVGRTLVLLLYMDTVMEGVMLGAHSTDSLIGFTSSHHVGGPRRSCTHGRYSPAE
jgi:hypothetical protein